MLYKSTDGGTVWTLKDSYVGDGGAVVLAPDDTNVIFTVGYAYAGTSYRVQTSLSTDGGATWDHETLADAGVRAYAAIFDPSNPSRILLGGDLSYTSSFLRISTDQGQTWSPADEGLSGPVTAIAAVPSQPGVFFCGTSQGCFRSNDSGATWVQVGSLSAVQALCIDTVDPAIMYAGTQTGVYSSTDAGATWTQFGSALPVTNVLSLALVSGPSGAVLAGTNGASAFKTAPFTGIAEGTVAKPAGYVRVAPNPAPGWAVITLALGSGDRASGSVLDCAGRKVADLGTAEVRAGTWRWTLDTRPLAEGAYFVRLSAGRKSAVARLVVTK